MTLTPEQKTACREAAEYIAERGHYKGSYFRGSAAFERVTSDDELNPPACALGAVAKVLRQDVELVRKEYSVLLSPVAPLPVQEWNDWESTSTEDVILHLKKLGSS